MEPRKNNTYELQEAQMSEKSQEFIKMLTQRGILGDKRITDDKARAIKRRRDRDCYHNTMLLLQNYRTLLWVMECFPETIAEELDKPLTDIDSLLEQIDLQLAMGNRKLESRLEGAKKSRVLLDRVNDALTVLKQKPGNGKKLYRLIYMTYIAPEQLTNTELLYRLDISSRHYYRLRQQAITILSIRLWSAPSTDVGLVMDMLAFLEDLE